MTNNLNKSDNFILISSGKGKPELSILMPIFNQAEFIKESLHSVLKQRGVIAEIIVSDDSSSDNTYELALKTIKNWLQKNECHHRILIRKGLSRLWRDHLPLLADKASCNILCQAHGDDFSLPDRARIIVYLFKKIPDASLFCSEAFYINKQNQIIGKRKPKNKISLEKITYDVLVNGHHPFLIGFSQAWRKDLQAPFIRLDRSFAATAHDRILPFRAALVGEVYLINSELVGRRNHENAARHLIFDEPGTNGRFGWSLSHISAKNAMLKDIKTLYLVGKISKQKHNELNSLIQKSINADVTALTEAYRQQTFSGRNLAWVDSETLMDIRSKRLVKY